jgi:recombination protein RecT
MSNEITAPEQKKLTVRSVLQQVNVKARFEEILKDDAAAFMTSIINITDSSASMSRIGLENPMSIIRSAAVAAALKLPIEKSLGFAWIIPYGSEAQFQIGYKGIIQLALRTGQYKTMNVAQVNEGALRHYDFLTEELDCDSGPVGIGNAIGFAVRFTLVNGFQKTVFYRKEDLLAHGKKYSKTFNNGPWKTEQDKMCAKTALKLTLSQWGIMSIDMKRANMADQAIVKGDDVDNPASFAYEDAIEAEFSEQSGTEGLANILKGKKDE